MKLTVLGCWAPYPRQGEACSGYLLQSQQANLMLDAGNGSFAELTKHITYISLAGLVITHFHPDHYADIYCIRHAIEGARREGRLDRPIDLFLPREPKELAEQLSGYTKAFRTFFIDDLPISDYKGQALKAANIGDLTLYFIQAVHSLPGYSVLVVDNSGRSFLYSGDSGKTEMLQKAASKVNCFLCEASGLDQDADYLKDIHLTARQAGLLAKNAGVEKLLITHFWPEYDINHLLKQAKEGFTNEVEAVLLGKEYII